MSLVRRIDGMSAFFLALALAAGTAVYLLRGPAVWAEAVGRAATLLVQVAPIITAAVLISGYVQTLVPRHAIERWLGRRSGFRGLALAVGTGILTPGGPFEVCGAYLTAWSVLGLNRAIVWEIPFFGLELVALKALVSLPLPFLAALLARPLARRLEPALC